MKPALIDFSTYYIFRHKILFDFHLYYLSLLIFTFVHMFSQFLLVLCFFSCGSLSIFKTFVLNSHLVSQYLCFSKAVLAALSSILESAMLFCFFLCFVIFVVVLENWAFSPSLYRLALGQGCSLLISRVYFEPSDQPKMKTECLRDFLNMNLDCMCFFKTLTRS